VTILEGRQPEGGVETRVLVVADAYERQLQQTHHRGEHFLARHATPTKIPHHAPADARQRAPERDEMAEFRRVAPRPVVPVIAVLLPPPGVASCRLQVAARIGADPDLSPGWRHGDRPDSFERAPAADAPASGIPADATPPGPL